MQARVEHVAIWVQDLEMMRAFYAQAFAGTCTALYENPSTGFRSYFVSLDEGARLELMHLPDMAAQTPYPHIGLAHLALALGSRDAVDTMVVTLLNKGASIASMPRVTGDGYYEAVILDPEGNRVELTV